MDKEHKRYGTGAAEALAAYALRDGAGPNIQYTAEEVVTLPASYSHGKSVVICCWRYTRR